MSDPPDTGVFICRLVWAGDEPLLGVRHYEDGDWEFWGDTEPNDENAMDLLMLIHLSHVVERFPEVAQLADLPPDRCAVRQSADEPFVEGD